MSTLYYRLRKIKLKGRNMKKDNVTVTILSGADQIGSNCVKVETAETMVYLDYGSPLTDKTEKNRVEMLSLYLDKEYIQYSFVLYSHGEKFILNIKSIDLYPYIYELKCLQEVLQKTILENTQDVHHLFDEDDKMLTDDDRAMLEDALFLEENLLKKHFTLRYFDVMLIEKLMMFNWFNNAVDGTEAFNVLTKLAKEKGKLYEEVLIQYEEIGVEPKKLPDAIVVSHAHQDHYGLISTLPNSIPVYASKYTTQMMKTTQIFTRCTVLKNPVVHFEHMKTICIGDIYITPYLMDHSSGDAFAFLVEACGQRIFYTGDFRATGRKSYLFDRLLENPPSNVDLLLMEGTMIKREEHMFRNEVAVEDAMSELMKNRLMTFFIFSSQNIDRVVSAYKASRSAGKIFVIDIYTAWVLEKAKLLSPNLPNMEWKYIKVLSKGDEGKWYRKRLHINSDFFGDFSKKLYQYNTFITLETIEKNPAQYTFKLSANIVLNIVKKLNTKANVIYSQWSGYQSKEYNPDGYEVFSSLKADPLLLYKEIHTSGHAKREDLQRLSQALQAKTVVPIHTNAPKMYEEFFENVKILPDGESLIVGDNNG